MKPNWKLIVVVSLNSIVVCTTCFAELPKEFSQFNLNDVQKKQIEEIFSAHESGISAAEVQHKNAKTDEKKAAANKTFLFRMRKRAAAIIAVMTPDQQEAYRIYRVQRAEPHESVISAELSRG